MKNNLRPPLNLGSAERCARGLAVILTMTVFAAAAPVFKAPPGYRIETIAPPGDRVLEVEGMAFAPDGSLYVSTQRGEIWHLAGQGGQRRWHRFAQGLQEPLGLMRDAVSGTIYAAQKSEITKVTDNDGDGVADTYLRVGGGWGYSGNYSEFTHGLARDSQGNFLVALNLSHRGPGGVKGSTMTHNAPYRGWVAQISPEGNFLAYASGLRSPCGITLDAADEIFVTDNQGDWMPASGLFHIVKGRFYGHPSSLADWPEFKGRNLDEIPTEEFDRLRSPPAVWIPYGDLANSPGQPTFDTTQGKFGPFAGQIFIGDQTRSNLVRAMIERVDGEYQGAVFNFADGFQSGLIRGAFAPDGSYWAGQIDHGWPTNAGMPGGLQRVVWDGNKVPFEIKGITLVPDGFVLEFTRPVDSAQAGQASAYEINHWRYPYQSRYYSQKLDQTDVTATRVTVLPGGNRIRIDIPLVVGRVYRIRSKVASRDGESLTNDTGWYTVNRLHPTRVEDRRATPVSGGRPAN